MDRLVHKIVDKRLKKWQVEIKQTPEGNFYPIVCNTHSLWNDNPILISDGRILYDFPERLPEYAKKLVVKSFKWIKNNE